MNISCKGQLASQFELSTGKPHSRNCGFDDSTRCSQMILEAWYAQGIREYGPSRRPPGVCSPHISPYAPSWRSEFPGRRTEA
jgi:hypothetical protein